MCEVYLSLWTSSRLPTRFHFTFYFVFEAQVLVLSLLIPIVRKYSTWNVWTDGRSRRSNGITLSRLSYDPSPVSGGFNKKHPEPNSTRGGGVGARLADCA